MIDTPIVDAHLHIWDIGRLRYPWLSDVPTLSRSFSLSDYREATARLTIEKMVFVQCEADPSQYLEEARWVASQAAVDPRIQGIVAWAPLEKGEAVREELAELVEIPLVRGIRRIIQFENSPDFCLDGDFVRGVQMLADFGLSFDLCLKGDEQFRNTLSLVRQCPDVSFILDHIGKPCIQEGIMEPWAGYIRELAAMPNTCCKISGLVNEADWDAWTPADLQPYLDHVLQSFGPDRVLFGGDWPVVLLASDYQRWLKTLKDAVEGMPAEQQKQLFCTNAIRIYRLHHS